MKKVALFLNNYAGLEIFDYFIKLKSSEIICIYLVDKNNPISKLILKKIGKKKIKVFFGKKTISDIKHHSWINKKNIDFIITVYWPWLIKKDYLILSKNSINFHPAYLPTNRGWYPHVYNILNDTTPGVTLHKLDEKPDSGPIWCQKKVPLREIETSYELYRRLEMEIINLFKSNWNKISTNKIKPKIQKNTDANYNQKSKINAIDKLDLNKKMTVDKFIKILKARSFDKKGFAFYVKNKKKFFLNLKISKNNNF